MYVVMPADGHCFRCFLLVLLLCSHKIVVCVFVCVLSGSTALNTILGEAAHRERGRQVSRTKMENKILSAFF